MALSDRILWANNISKTHDGRTHQFKDMSLTIPRGAKLALLGRNGSGKSTLLSVLAGLMSPDSGEVSTVKEVSLALVSQELPSDLDPEQTVLHAVMHLAVRHTTAPDVRAALSYARAVADAETGGKEALVALTAAAARMETVDGAWEVESYLLAALQRLGLPSEKLLRDLSGGQKRRVAIAAALVSRPDILLLDEVTNHLSIEGIQFLEDVLQDPRLTIICISHDRYFVDAVCTTGIWELDGELVRYPPGYDAFLKEKAARIENEKREMANLAKAFRKELEWMRKQPKARGTKSKARVEEVARMQKELKNRTRSLKRSSVRNLASSTTRMGTNVLELKNVTLKRGDKLILRNFNYTFERGERVGICGGNGVGKSSFLKALLGLLPIESGDIEVGKTVMFGHFDQDGIDLTTPLSEASIALLDAKNSDEIRVIDYVSELTSLFGVHNSQNVNTSQTYGKNREEDAEARLTSKIEALSHSVALPVSSRVAEVSNPLAKMSPISMLDHFGFERDKQHNFVSRLSGGEKRRLQLMALLLKNPNFLLLDEVSNDLDVNTLTMLEELLLDYTGVLVLCSHDRFMLDRLVDHLVIIEGNGEVGLVEGKFTDYLSAKQELEAEEKRNKKDIAIEAAVAKRVELVEEQSGKQKKRLSYKEKREYERLEGEIDEYQEKHAELTVRMEKEAGDAGYSDLLEWSEELARLEAEIDKKTERWLELAEISGS